MKIRRWWSGDVSHSLEDSRKALQIYEKLLAEQHRSVELRLAAVKVRLDLANTFYFNDQIIRACPRKLP